MHCLKAQYLCHATGIIDRKHKRTVILAFDFLNNVLNYLLTRHLALITFVTSNDSAKVIILQSIFSLAKMDYF